MDYKRILVPFDGSEAGLAAVETALDVAAHFDAHVDVLFISDTAERLAQVIRPVFGGEGFEEMVSTAEHRVHDQLAAAEAAYRALMSERGVAEREVPLESPGVTVSWQAVEGPTGYVVAERGAVHDLTVVGHPMREGAANTRDVAEAALFSTGRPALVAPAAEPGSLGKRILIGWNRSAQSARAVAAAMPLIGRAEAVHIFSVKTGAKRGAAPDSVAEYLAWHGISATVQEIEPDYRVIGEALLEDAAEFEADLLVMGAYSHNRLRELILGGVTTYVLANAELPVLMAL